MVWALWTLRVCLGSRYLSVSVDIHGYHIRGYPWIWMVLFYFTLYARIVSYLVIKALDRPCCC